MGNGPTQLATQLLVNDCKLSMGQLFFHILASVLPCVLALSCTQVAAKLFCPSCVPGLSAHELCLAVGPAVLS